MCAGKEQDLVVIVVQNTEEVFGAPHLGVKRGRVEGNIVRGVTTKSGK